MRSRAAPCDAVGVVGQHPIDFFDRRDAGGDELERVVAHRGKSGGAHGRSNLERGGAAADGVAERVGGRQQLGDRHAPQISGVIAVLAAGAG